MRILLTRPDPYAGTVVTHEIDCLEYHTQPGGVLVLQGMKHAHVACGDRATLVISPHFWVSLTHISDEQAEREDAKG